MPRPPSSPSPPPLPFVPFTAGSFDFPHASAPPRHAARETSRRPPTANPARPRATPSERYLRRSQARIREHRAHMESAADLLETLTDVPLNSPFPPSTSNVRPRSPTADTINDRRQSKRRKLHHEVRTTCKYDGFKYGYKGQVVPGRLKMQIVSCDGGEYSEQDMPSLYTVQNVLRNDKSVYCSQSSRCNLLLKHIGNTPFTLEKIVIRAPDRGFTAPVQEGLIFVSMSSDDLLSRTAAYDLHYSGRSPSVSSAKSKDSDHEELSFQEAMEDPYIWQHSTRASHQRLSERIENLRLRASLLRESALRSERSLREDRRPSIAQTLDENGEHCDRVTDEANPGVSRVSAPTPPPFTVITGSEEEASDSNEDIPSAAVIVDRLRRNRRWRAESDDDDPDSLPPISGIRGAMPPDLSLSNAYREWIEPIRASQIRAPSRIATTERNEGDESLLPPHARFFIAKNKSKITIKFHPAISGKNILLKLWSPTHDGNIDIESVQFYGYSGPRFFPAMQPC